jgi:N-methylhydantoinase A
MVPHEDHLTLSERMGPNGEVLLPLDPADVSAIIDVVRAGGYEAVAIGLMHSYVNDSHEVQMAQTLRGQTGFPCFPFLADFTANARIAPC